MKACIINFEAFGKAGFIYCHSILVDETKELLIIQLNKINDTAYISSVGHGLKIPNEQIEKYSLENWIKNNEIYLK